jgi:DNA repair protein RadC
MERNSLKIKEWAAEERPREKMAANGAAALCNSELLAIILGSGSRSQTAVELARSILAETGQRLKVLAQKNLEELTKIHGVGLAKAVQIKAALELARRIATEEFSITQSVESSKDAYNMLYPVLEGISHEEFWVLFLNRSNRVIGKKAISKGGISGTVFDVRIILKQALEHQASSLIIGHNHPSGNAKPSEQDKIITNKLKSSAALMDIQLLDHIIIAGNTYYSFADENLL